MFTDRKIEKLSAQLNAASPEKRLSAVRHLGRIRDPRAVDLLIERLKEKTGTYKRRQHRLWASLETRAQWSR